MKRLLLFTVTSIFLLYACGGGQPSDNSTGDGSSVAFSIVYHGVENNLMLPDAQINCDRISYIEALVYDQNDAYLQKGGPWDCDQRNGKIASVPAGSNRTIVITGRDGDDNIVLRGNTSIDVVAGSENDAGIIDCYDFIPTLSFPANGALINTEPVELGWSQVAGASEYRIIVSKNSDLSNPVIDVTVTTENFTPTGLSEGQTYYWQIVASDRYSNTGLGSLMWSFIIYIPQDDACSPLPSSGNWVVSTNCTLYNNYTAPANAEVTNGSVLTIPNGVTLDIDLVNYNLTVRDGSGVLIKQGGKID
jgi:hypothetical protein